MDAARTSYSYRAGQVQPNFRQGDPLGRKQTKSALCSAITSAWMGKVELDPTFAQTVNMASDYHVFLTPEGDCRGLYVSHKTAVGFEVHEFGGGQSNVAFDYRILVLRRGYETVRLENMTERLKTIQASQPARLSAQR